MKIFHESKQTIFDSLKEYLGSPELSILIVLTTRATQLVFLRIFG